MAPSDWLLRRKHWLDGTKGFGIIKDLDENGLIRQIYWVINNLEQNQKNRVALVLFKQVLNNRGPYCRNGSILDTADYWEDLANASLALVSTEPKNDNLHTLCIITIIRFVHCGLSNLILHLKCILVDEDHLGGRDAFLADLKALATLLEEEIIDDDGNVTRRKVEPLLEDGVISWDVNWDVPEEWHDEARAILIEWNRLRSKMRRLLIHAWFAEEAWLG